MSGVDLIPECSDTGTQEECVWQYSSKGAIVYNEYDACSRTPILLPGFNLLPDWLLAIVYGLALVWCFFGIAIISDIFMSSIEVITSLEKEVTRKRADGSWNKVTVLVWNASVANLSLMALGSSAPEIMIAVIETVVSLGSTPGEIGPSTIVGSAAFNLLIISAVCIMAVPEGEVKSISEFSVFIWTAIVSLWAYMWMLIVYQFWTPDQVTMLEAFLTLAFMPVLIGVAYMLDAKPWQKGVAAEAYIEPQLYQIVVGARGTDDEGHQYTITREEIHDFRRSHQLQTQDEHEVAKLVAHSKHYGEGANAVVDLVSAIEPDSKSFPLPGMQGAPMLDTTWYNNRSSSEKAKILHALAELRSNKKEAGFEPEISEHEVEAVVKNVVRRQSKEMSALQYKINARNALTGRSHVSLAYASSIDPKERPPLKRSSAPADYSLAHLCKLRFASEEYRVLESQMHVRLAVHCHRPSEASDLLVSVRYRTRDGSAQAGADYEEAQGMLLFEPGTSTQQLMLTVFEDDEVEEDEDFYVDLLDVNPPNVFLQHSTARVTIVDTTEAGVLQFEDTHISVPALHRSVDVSVIRKGGCSGVMKVDYFTQSDTAVAGLDFRHTEGSLVFDSGESKKVITVYLLRKESAGTSLTVCLRPASNTSTLSGGVQVSRRRAMCSVSLVEDESAGKINSMVERIIESRSGPQLHDSAWVQQFRDAVTPGAAVDEDGEELPLSLLTIVLHYMSITWKLIFAIVPPPEMYYSCFVISLVMIGGLTYVVAPLASMFGCAVGLSDLMTAIVFVALGTSLPDTFASYQAATQASDADAAIGNVTGSNSVNVFLGLGLPWVIAAIYYEAKGERYETPAGDLSFSVLMFMVCALCCLTLFMIKRAAGGELGGRGLMRTGVAAVLVALWFFYLIMSGLQSTGKIEWNV
eukprot:jgi/Ulvmu1/7053/UM033_0113.1